MTYHDAIIRLIADFPGRMFTYDDPSATIPAPGINAMWGDGLLVDTMDREEAGPIPGEYSIHDGAIWWEQDDGEYPVPMVQAIL